MLKALVIKELRESAGIIAVALLAAMYVLASVTGVDRRGRREGAIVEVLERRQSRLIGRFGERAGIGYVAPDDRRLLHDVKIEHVGHQRHGARGIVYLQRDAMDAADGGAGFDAAVGPRCAIVPIGRDELEAQTRCIGKFECGFAKRRDAFAHRNVAPGQPLLPVLE